MSEMVERVAIAIRDVDSTIWVGPDQMAYFRKAAVAAIEAMRVPTRQMVIAGANAECGDSGIIGSGAAREAWQEMIEEALK